MSLRRDPRSMPVFLARTINLLPFLGWTDKYCSGGCGYPTTGEHLLDLDKIDGVPVRVTTCGDRDCINHVLTDPRDQSGTHYADIRPVLVETVRMAKEAGTPASDLTLSFGR